MKCGGESRSVGRREGVTVGRETGDITVDLICDVLEFKLYAAIIIYMK